MNGILHNRYFKFGVVTFIYILFVIWLRNYWFLLGIPVIYDLYVSQKVNWTFWKKRKGKNSTVIEWLDALIFAVVAVTLINIYLFQNYKIPTPSMESTLMVGDHLYVSKVAYGPRAPMTPLSFPFSQNRVGNFESYVKWIQLDYKRLAGFGHVQRNDIVVFNFPAGDTVILENSAASYYSIAREVAYSNAMSKNDPAWEKYIPEAKSQLRNSGRIHIVERPVDRKDNYVKRCVAIPGDSLKIIHGQVYINGEAQPAFKGIQHDYLVQTNGRPLNPRALEEFDIPSNILGIQNNPNYILPLTIEKAERLKREVPDIIRVEQRERQGYNYQLFPHDPNYRWNDDNFGPVWIPKKGTTINIDISNISFYKRIIEAYEKNSLRIDGDRIFINGKEARDYTFKMDYYWMMGDNRHASSDSRYWGYVPEDHIVGKPKFIWLSLDKNKKFLNKIRLNRMFSSIDPSK